MQIEEIYTFQEMFGVDVDDLRSSSVVLDDHAVGFPLLRLADIPSGDYWVQAVFVP